MMADPHKNMLTCACVKHDNISFLFLFNSKHLSHPYSLRTLLTDITELRFARMMHAGKSLCCDHKSAEAT